MKCIVCGKEIGAQRPCSYHFCPHCDHYWPKAVMLRGYSGQLLETLHIVLEREQYQVAAVIPLLVLEMRFAVEIRTLLTRPRTRFFESLAEEDRRRYREAVEKLLDCTDTNDDMALLSCWIDNLFNGDRALLPIEGVQVAFWRVFKNSPDKRHHLKIYVRTLVDQLPPDYRSPSKTHHLAKIIATRHAPDVDHGKNLYARYELSRSIRNKIVHADFRMALGDQRSLLPTPWTSPARVHEKHALFIRRTMFDFIDFFMRAHLGKFGDDRKQRIHDA